MKHRIVLLAAVLLCTAVHAEGIYYTVGAVAAVEDMVYIDMKDDRELQGAPFVAFDSDHLFFTMGVLGAHVYQRETDSVALALDSYVTMGDGYRRSDSPRFRGMARRHEHVDIGVALELSWALGHSLLSVQQDVSGRSKGLLASYTHSLPWPVGQVVVAPTLRLDLMTARHVEYYYGVRPEEVLPDRAAYRGRQALNISGGYLLSWMLTPEWMLYQGVEYTWLDDAIEDSPLVARDHLVSGMLGVTYSF